MRKGRRRTRRTLSAAILLTLALCPSLAFGAEADDPGASEGAGLSPAPLPAEQASPQALDVTWQTSGTCEWSIDSTGTLTVRPSDGVSGTLEAWEGRDAAPWYGQSESITAVKFEPGVSAATCYCLFQGCSSLTSVDLSNLDTSNVHELGSMFSGCSSLASVDLSPLNTSNVESTYWMFDECSSLRSLSLKPLNMSNVTNMSGMFCGCSSLSSLSLSGLDTSKVTNMAWMFQGCSSLTSLNLKPLNTSNVTNMSGMFADCPSLKSVSLSGLDTSKVTNMAWMFQNCSSLESLDLSGLDTSKVENMTCMFVYCSSLSTLNLSGLNTSKVTNMDYLFYDCSSLMSLDLSSFNTSKVTSMTDMFYGCSALSKVKIAKTFVSESGTMELPKPSGEDYTGEWKNSVTGKAYAPDAVPAGVSATYVWKKVSDEGAQELSGEWVRSSNGKWWYRYSDGSYPYDEWLYDGGSWYRFDADGWMQTGWVRASVDLNGKATPGNDGRGAWYFLSSGGQLATGAWRQDTSGWCYVDDETGEMWFDRWTRDSHGPCYIGHEGYCLTGWFVVDTDVNGSSTPGAWYYADGSGCVKCGNWYKDSTGWCYTDPETGMMWTSRWAADSVGPCYIGEEGYCLTGWFRAAVDCNGKSTPGTDGAGAWYHANSSGQLDRDKWMRDSTGWCWLDSETGEMWANKWIEDSVGWCFIGEAGYCVTGRWNITSSDGQEGNPGSGIYTFDADGRMTLKSA